MNDLRTCPLLFIAVLTATAAFGQNARNLELPAIATDRPDFTEGTSLVPPRLLQFETGYSFDREVDRYGFSSPEMLVRIGINRYVELRFGDTGLQLEKNLLEDPVWGRSDAEIAAKIRMIDEDRRWPALSLIPLLSLPAGHQRFSGQGYDPTLKLAWSKDLPHGFSASGNLNVSSLCGAGGRYRQEALRWSVSHGLGPAIGLYVETYTLSPWDQDTSSAWLANAATRRERADRRSRRTSPH